LDINESTRTNVKDVVAKYISYWKWFLLSAILGISLGYAYLRYQTPVYEVNASLLIKDERKGTNISDELSAFEDLGILKNSKNIDNEIEVLKSRSLMNLVVNELKLKVQYFSYGLPIEHERYLETPYVASYVAADSIDVVGNWLIYPEDNIKFTLKDGKGKVIIGNYKFGDTIPMPFGKLIVATTENANQSYYKKDFRIIINPFNGVVDRYLGAIKVTPITKNGGAISISLRDPLPKKAVDIVNNLIKQHNLDAIADKNQVSLNTYNFISERINFIAKELNEVEGYVEEFKRKNKLFDIKTDGTLLLESSEGSEKLLIDAHMEKKIADYMVEYLAKPQNANSLIPNNIDISDEALSGQIASYNTLVLERNRLLKYSSEKNPAIDNLETQIKNRHFMINESFVNYQKALDIRLKEISKRDNEIDSKIRTVPRYEREYRNIQRQQKIKEDLYL